jgi:hypothetical protein
MRNWDLTWGMIFLFLGVKMLHTWQDIVEWIGRKAFFFPRFRMGQVILVITVSLIITAVGVLGLSQFILDRDLWPFFSGVRRG